MSLLEGLDGFVDGDCGEEGVGAEIALYILAAVDVEAGTVIFSL